MVRRDVADCTARGFKRVMPTSARLISIPGTSPSSGQLYRMLWRVVKRLQPLGHGGFVKCASTLFAPSSTCHRARQRAQYVRNAACRPSAQGFPNLIPVRESRQCGRATLTNGIAQHVLARNSYRSHCIYTLLSTLSTCRARTGWSVRKSSKVVGSVCRPSRFARYARQSGCACVSGAVQACAGFAVPHR
jgi:hypothetical protein